MSGMFERIARRQADRPDEDDAQATAEVQPATDPPAPAEVPVGDRPTERMEAVTPPPPTVDLAARVEAGQTEPTVVQSPDTPPADATAVQPSAVPTPAQTDAATVVAAPPPRRPGFRARGRMRRRLRYLRKLRELQVRDLGGLVFDLRRFERKREDLIAQKIDQIRACDDELHALEQALDERRDLRDVREPGVGGTCPRCFAIYGSADKFCANCGAAFGGAVQGPAAQIPLAPPAATHPATTPPSAPQASGPGEPGSQA
jgi:hypothetical protein